MLEQVNNSKNQDLPKNEQCKESEVLEGKIFPKIPKNRRLIRLTNIEKIDRNEQINKLIKLNGDLENNIKDDIGKTVFQVIKDNPNEAAFKLMNYDKPYIQNAQNEFNSFIQLFYDTSSEKKKSRKEVKKKFTKREWRLPIHNTIRKRFKEKSSMNLIATIFFLGCLAWCFYIGIAGLLHLHTLGEHPIRSSDAVNSAVYDHNAKVVPQWEMGLLAGIAFVLFWIYFLKYSYYNMGEYNKTFLLLIIIIFGLFIPITHSVLILSVPVEEKALEGYDSVTINTVVLLQALPMIYLPILITLFLDTATVKKIPPNGLMYMYALWVRLECENYREKIFKHDIPKYFTLLLKKLDNLLYKTLSVRISNLEDLAERFTQMYLLDYEFTKDLIVSNFDCVFFDLLNYSKEDKEPPLKVSEKDILGYIHPALLVIVLDRINNILNKDMLDYENEYKLLIKHKYDLFSSKARRIFRELNLVVKSNDTHPVEMTPLLELTNDQKFKDIHPAKKQKIINDIREDVAGTENNAETRDYLRSIVKLLNKQYEETHEEKLEIQIQFESYFGRLKRRSTEIFSSLAIIGGVIGTIIPIFLG